MGNNNNKNNKQKPKRYKGKNVNPMSGPAQMGQHGMRIIRNLAFGNFNMETDGVYFQNRDFIIAVMNEVQTKVREQSIYNMALDYTYGASTDILVGRMINNHKRSLDAWSLVYNTLAAILNTGDLTLLVGLMSRLPDYRYVM